MKKFAIAAATFCLLFAAHAFAQYLVPTQVPMIYVGTGPSPTFPPTAVGYNTLTFSTNSFTTSNVDVSNSGASGFNWYIYNLNRSHAPSAGDVVLPGDGTVKLTGNSDGAEIATVSANYPNYTNYVGTAFGGGAYFEYTVAMPNTTCCVTTAAGHGWPRMGAYNLEASAIGNNANCQLAGFNASAPCNAWPGASSSSFQNNMEVEFFQNHYGYLAPSIIETFGAYGVSCPPYLCSNTSNLAYAQTSGLNLLQLHKYGVLWVPATATTSGYMNFYIDNVLQSGTSPVGSTASQTWTQVVNTAAGYASNPATALPNFCGGVANSTSCANPSWRFGVLDAYHLIPFIGAGVDAAGVGGTTAANPVILYAFNVWQANASGNVTNGYLTLTPPTISPATGTYSSTQTVSISAPAGAAIYYTTDGSTPTYPVGSSTTKLYAGTFNVTTSRTISAIAVKAGYSNSAVASSTITINTGGATLQFSYPSGFASAGSAVAFAGSHCQVTAGVILAPKGDSRHETCGVWYATKQNIQSFTTDFTFSQNGAYGFFFVAQNNNQTSCDGGYYGTNSVADANGEGYGDYVGQCAAIQNSIGINFANVQYANTLPNLSTSGSYVNGGPIETLFIPSQDLRSTGVDLSTTHIMGVTIVYDGTEMHTTIHDTVTGASARLNYPVNIPLAVGGGTTAANTAWVGFTGGGVEPPPVNKLYTWDYSTSYNTRLSAPSLSVAAGSYAGAQTVTVGNCASPITCYYTTNGNDPTQYNGTLLSGTSITVNSSEILQIVAIEAGFTDSAVTVANYQIGSTSLPRINLPNMTNGANFLATGGHALLSGSQVQFGSTPGQNSQSSLWYRAPLNINAFTTSFTLNLQTNGNVNGVCFVLQNSAAVSVSNRAIPGSGGPYALGAPETTNALATSGLLNSFVVSFDNSNGNTSKTGIATGGGNVQSGEIDMSGTLNLNSGHTFLVTLTYSGTTLTESVKDTTTNATFNHTYSGVNIPGAVGGSNDAWVGFTNLSSAGNNAYSTLSSWTLQ